MTSCDHTEVRITHFNGEAGWLKCEDCGAVRWFACAYEWEKPDD